MSAPHVIALASGLILSVSASAEPPRPLDPADRTILNIRLSAAVLETFREQGGKLPSPLPSFETLDSVLPALGADLRREIATKDGWGNAIRILIERSDDFSLISFGSDGRPDHSYAEGVFWEGEAPSEFDGTDPSRPDRDIIFVLAERGFVQRPRRPDGQSARAAAEIRMLATAIESYAVDNDAYPGPTAGPQTAATLMGALEPLYIKKLPLFDPWRQPYIVWSNGKSYFIVSRGADWKLDRSYDDLGDDLARLGPPQATSDDNEDIVFADGQFVRWPAAIMAP